MPKYFYCRSSALERTAEADSTPETYQYLDATSFQRGDADSKESEVEEKRRGGKGGIGPKKGCLGLPS